jgi:glycosyltransferase involved in cell wall biosynthesis
MSSTDAVRLSIVTVCWNDLANVQRTIDSLQRQTARQGWEHILVDGASDDGTADWYRSAGFDFAHQVVSEPDDGIFDAMNKSLDIVSGDYVVFMNAGDRYADEGVVGRLLRRIESGPAWGYGKARVIDGAGRQVYRQIGKVPYSRVSHLLSIGIICHQAVVMRLDLLRELGGFDLRMGNAADYHLLIRAASRATPATWADVDVDYLAGGVTDTEHGLSDLLWLGHRSRVDALALKQVGTRLDGVWTTFQIVQFRARKKIKRLLSPVYDSLRKR